LLFVNNKDNTFSEKAADYGLDDLSASQHANFFDYDLDGDLDVYIVNHPVDFSTINNLDFLSGDARRQKPRNQWESDRLLQNNSGKFSDVTEKAGLLNRAFGLSSLVADFNGDGWQDLFVGNDFVMPDFLYINNKNGTFSDQAERYFRHTSNHTMGVDMADLNRDGWSDLIALDMLAETQSRRLRLMNTMQLNRDKQMRKQGYGKQVMRNVLQLNNGHQGFNEIGCLAGIYATDWSWASLLADYDNDGWCDVFISNGVQRDLNDLDFFVFTADSINKTMPSQPVHNYLYRNKGGLQFDDVSAEWGFSNNGFSNGAAYSDLDNDGDLDLITNNLQVPPVVYENITIGLSPNNWLQLKCVGTAQNPMGLGSQVRVYAKDETGAQIQVYQQEMTNVRGFYSSVEPIFQVGLGMIKTIERVEIEWAEGKNQVLSNVPVNQRISLKIDEAKPGKLPRAGSRTSMYFEEQAAKMGLKYAHQENIYEDFDHEKLLPYRLSQTGPCLSIGDLNADGLEDVFVGGAMGSSPALFIQNNDGTFSQKSQDIFESHKKYEDTASAFLDADGDGDLDLYVVSGGNESPAGSDNYQDRLYLNNGLAQFTYQPDALPRETSAGSCVTVFDYDGDGKSDLFVGGRSIPGRFPEPSSGLILKNTGSGFKNVATSIAPSFEKTGMVTDIQFGDLNGDGKAEMVVLGDWMAIQVFEWNGQYFVDKTSDYGLSGQTGLWRCLTLSDVNGDGQLDILAGNLGLNTRFKAADSAPLRLFAVDFDKNGSIDPIIVLAEGDKYKPIAQRELLASQMPVIKKKFPRNRPFAEADISEIFPAKELTSGIKLEAATLETRWFLNQNGKFIPQTLPAEAQFAPVEQILTADLNADGHLDILLLGNDFGLDIETYQADASDGYVLWGTGNGHFSPRLTAIGASADVRDAGLIHSKIGEKYLVVANSNGPLQCFRYLSSKN
jgi:hypothetical protein